MSRIRVKAPRAIVGAALAIALASGIAAAAPAGAAAPGDGTTSGHPPTEHRAYTRTVEPYYVGHVAATPPSVLPTVTCVRSVGPGQLEVVFGYQNVTTKSQEARIDPTIDPSFNHIAHRQGDTTTIQDYGPQATEFLPGNHPYAFALRIPKGEVPSWEIVVPPTDPAESFNLWSISVTPTFNKWCGSRVPRHFATIQSAGIGAGETDKVRDADGNVTDYKLTASFAPVVTACSEGGTPIEADSIVGWSLDDANLVPLDKRDVIRTVHEGIGTLLDSAVQKTRVLVRSVADPSQHVHLYAPSRDVYGGCSFPDGTTAKALVYWDTPDWYGEWFLEKRDGPIDVYWWAVAPGGVRTR